MKNIIYDGNHKVDLFCEDINQTKNKSIRKGFTLIEALFVISIFLVILAIAIFVVYPKVNLGKEKIALSSQYQTIMNGLDSYYSDNDQYPAGSGWSWNTDNTYVPASIIAKGWQYQCSTNTMTIETPDISNKKLKVALENTFKTQVSQNGGSVSEDGNKIKVTIPDKPCPSSN